MGTDLNGKELGIGISQRPDGRYIARFVDRYKKRHTFYSRDLKSLRKKLDKEKYEAEYGIGGEGTRIKVSDWFDEFLKCYKEGKVKETTLYTIKQSLDVCRRSALGSMWLNEVRAIHVQQFINNLHAEDYTYGTINRLNALLKEVFKKAIGNGYMVINPCDSVVMPPKVKYESRYLTEEEQQMFMEVAKDYYHYDIFCVSLSLGARIGEVLGLKWDDIDFVNKTIHIQRTLHYAKLNKEDVSHFFFTTPKTESSARKIPMMPETEAVFKRVRKKQLMNKMLHISEWLETEPFDNLVFTTQWGAPVRYGDVNRTIKMAVVKANLQEEELAKLENREAFVLKPFSPHCFRHTFVTRCKMNGVDYEVIQPYVGHSNKEMTMYYNHNKPEIDVSDMKKISFLGVV